MGQAHAEERSSREKAEEFHQQVGTAARCTLHFLDTHNPICASLCRFMESSKWAMVFRVTQPLTIRTWAVQNRDCSCHCHCVWTFSVGSM